MIVVAGGSGTLGTLLVTRLAGRQMPVRVLTRDPARARHLSGVDVVRADVRDPASLSIGVSGAAVVVSAVHGFIGAGLSPTTIDYQGNVNLTDAAARAGAALVMTSIVGAAPDSPIGLFRAKYQAEQHLRQSGVPWTIVRATAFAETWSKLIGEPLLTNGQLLVFGRGDNPINFVSAVDVAAMLEAAVVDATLRGRVIELGGPDNVTFNQLAAMLQEIVGRRGVVRHVPRPALRAMALLMKPIKPELARQAEAAVAMDTIDMSFDAAAARHAFAGIPITDLRTAIERCFAGVAKVA